MASDVQVDIDVETRAAMRALARLEKEFSGTEKAATKSVSRMDIAVGAFAGTIATKLVEGGFRLATAALREFSGQITQGIAAAQVQEDAINELNTQLKLNGELTAATSQNLQDFASELQSTTKFGDEAIISQLAFAQAMGASAEQSKTVVGAGADLAASLNIDLNSAVRNVSKTLGGYAGELGEVIPELKDLTTEQLRAGEGVALLAEKFSGAASDQIQTFSGATAQLSNTFGDFQESLGGLVTNSPVAIAALKALEKGFRTLTGDINSNQEELTTLVEDGIKDALITGVDLATGAIIKFNGAITTTQNFVSFLADTFLAANESTAKFSLGFAELQRTIAEFTGANTAAFDETIRKTKQEIEVIQQARLAGDIEVAKRIEAQDKLKESLKDTSKVVKETLTSQIETQRKAQEERQAELDNATADPRVAAEEQASKAILEKRRKLNADLNLIAAEQDMLNEEKRITKQESQFERREQQIDALFEFEQRKANVAAEQRQIAIDKLQDADTKALEQRKSNAQKEIDIQKATQKQEAAIADARVKKREAMVGGFGMALSQATQLAKKGSREQQALAAGSAVVNTYAAATRAYRDYPFPANIAVMATTIASGLAQVSKINSQSFQSGGVVGGFSGATGGADNTTANVRTGEMILNAAQQRNLFDVAKNGVDNSDLVESINRLASRPISVQVEGKEIARVVRDARKDGFAI